MTNPGTLYLVGTPIGNLDDITFRAIATLKTVDLIAAEDTRQTGKLLHHFQIATPQISYHQHNHQERHRQLLAQLHDGKTIALVTDAGMPAISDPGYELVKACVDHQVPVVPIPGVTAAITALAASGLTTEEFVFVGFLPQKQKRRQEQLHTLAHERRTMVFYEAPHRLRKTLEDWAEHFSGDRPVTIARELTKIHEEFWRGTVAQAIAHFQIHKPRGEFTLVLAGKAIADQLILSPAEIKAELQKRLDQGLTKSAASKELAKITNLPKRELYDIANQL